MRIVTLLLVIFLNANITFASNRDREWFNCRSGKVCQIIDYRYLRVTHISGADFRARAKDFVEIYVNGPGCAVSVSESETKFYFNSNCSLYLYLSNGYVGKAELYFDDAWEIAVMKRGYYDPLTDTLNYQGKIRARSDIPGGSQRMGSQMVMNIGFDNEVFIIRSRFRERNSSYLLKDYGAFK